MLLARIALVFFGLALPLAAGDLAKVYPGHMTWSQHGLSWTSTPEDAWALKSFEFEFGSDLEIRCGEAFVVFGVHDGNALWACVFPNEPAEIVSDLEGGGERAQTILLRFAPAEVGRVFPKKTVGKNGGAWLRAEAGRIFRHKVGWKWYTPSGNPTIVQPGWTLIDIDTVDGKRRFYGVDKNSNSIEYVAKFESKPTPPTTPIDEEEALAAFDEVWGAFDQEYAKFHLLPKLKWDKLGEQYREAAGSVDNTYQLGGVLSDMLAHLEDLHIWVKVGNDGLPGYRRDRPLNANWTATKKAVNATKKAGSNLVWGKTDDGIGYVGITGLSDDTLPDEFDRALEQLGETWGLILDLRMNGGGNELLARQIAGRFVDEEHVYSLNQYRNGPKHSDLGETLERKVTPRGPWRYESPVVVLWGQKTLSSAESFALMMAQCPQAITMGDASGGSSGNPRRLQLECGISVNLPRWNDMTPKGDPIERAGVRPAVQVKWKLEQMSDEEDPVINAALARLRKTSKSKREPGKR